MSSYLSKTGERTAIYVGLKITKRWSIEPKQYTYMNVSSSCIENMNKITNSMNLYL